MVLRWLPEKEGETVDAGGGVGVSGVEKVYNLISLKFIAYIVCCFLLVLIYIIYIYICLDIYLKQSYSPHLYISKV